jgi:hypothetical protein
MVERAIQDNQGSTGKNKHLPRIREVRSKLNSMPGLSTKDSTGKTRIENRELMREGMRLFF